MKLRGKTVFILFAAVFAGLIIISSARVWKARAEADRFAGETGIKATYETGTVIDSKAALLTEIWKLAVWEQETREALNRAYDYTDQDYAVWKAETKTGFERKEELLSWALGKKWHALRETLSDTVKSSIKAWFGETGEAYGLQADAVTTCYSENRFIRIVDVMKSLEEGAGMEAYVTARSGLDEDWSALPMDIAYGLRPKLMKAGCEAHLLSAQKSNDLYDIESAVRSAKEFENRYGITIDGIENAESKQKRLEYANKPDIPAVGMSVAQAKSTKLGSPSRTTKETGSWSHAKHTYGDMYWDRGDRQIFRVHYYDGEITDVYDSRNVTEKSPWAGSRGSGSSSKPVFDPDDHDIEAYYQDNLDEYDDYDDAYEGFLDDEGVWDDY